MTFFMRRFRILLSMIIIDPDFIIMYVVYILIKKTPPGYHLRPQGLVDITETHECHQKCKPKKRGKTVCFLKNKKSRTLHILFFRDISGPIIYFKI